MRQYMHPIRITRHDDAADLASDYDALQLPAADRVLPYDLQQVSAKQPVLDGRWQLMPKINLGDYRFEARFDWIDLAVNTNRDVMPLNLGKRLNNALKEPGKGGAHAASQLNHTNERTRQVVIRLQDPSRRRFEKMFHILEGEYGVLGNERWVHHRIWAWELAIDITPKASRFESGADLIQQRILMSELIRKHLNPSEIYLSGELSEQNDWMRCYDKAGQAPQFHQKSGHKRSAHKEINGLLLAAAHPNNHRPSWLEGTVYLGAKKRSGKFRLQDKCKDQRRKAENPNGKAKAKLLDVKDRRTRIEITVGKHEDYLQDDLPETGIETIDDIATFKFDQIRSELFDMVLPTVASNEHGEPDQTELAIFENTGAIGLKLYAQGRREIERAESVRDETGRLPVSVGVKGHNMGFETFSRKLRDALKSVSKNFENG